MGSEGGDRQMPQKGDSPSPGALLSIILFENEIYFKTNTSINQKILIAYFWVKCSILY